MTAQGDVVPYVRTRHVKQTENTEEKQKVAIFDQTVIIYS